MVLRMPGTDPPPDLIMIGVPGSSPVECRHVEKLSLTLEAGTSEADRAVLEAELAELLDVEVSVSVAT